MHQLISKQKSISYTKRSSCICYTHTHTRKGQQHTQVAKRFIVAESGRQDFSCWYTTLSLYVYLYKSLHISLIGSSLYRLLVPCWCVLYTPRTDMATTLIPAAAKLCSSFGPPPHPPANAEDQYHVMSWWRMTVWAAAAVGYTHRP